MKIKSVDLSEYSIPFRESFRRAGGNLGCRLGIVVTVRSSDNLVGFGEIAPMPGHSRETLDIARQQAGALSRDIVGWEIPPYVDELAQFTKLFTDTTSSPIPPSVIFGFETAIADLASKIHGLPLCRWLSPAASASVAVNALLPDDVGALRRAARDLISRGYSTYKLKAGVGRVSDDIELVRTARVEFGDRVKLRIDANRAWDFDTAASALSELSLFEIEYVEEPLLLADNHRLSELHFATGVDIAVDETVIDQMAWHKCMQTDGVVAAVIKPTIVGGIARSIELIRHVASIGKKAVITTCFESAVGTAACLHLAAAQKGAVLPSGLDTLRFLADTLSDVDFAVEQGRITVPQAPGLGIEPRLNHGQ